MAALMALLLAAQTAIGKNIYFCNFKKKWMSGWWGNKGMEKW
jgi:hypothetical protein